MVSVIVRTKNEEKHIGYCIQSITDFIGKPEIIIVDNDSTDNTIPILIDLNIMILLNYI